jgi:hypothetical protein
MKARVVVPMLLVGLWGGFTLAGCAARVNRLSPDVHNQSDGIVRLRSSPVEGSIKIREGRFAIHLAPKDFEEFVRAPLTDTATFARFAEEVRVSRESHQEYVATTTGLEWYLAADLLGAGKAALTLEPGGEKVVEIRFVREHSTTGTRARAFYLLDGTLITRVVDGTVAS